MNRDKLAQVATKYVNWINTTPIDREIYTQIASKEIVVPIPYPGSTPNFEGLLAIAAAAHAAAEGFHMSIKTMIIDEEQSTVALLINVTGKHVG